MAPTRSGTTPARIHQAKVLDVNVANWTLSVHTEFTQKPLTDIPFAVPYMHPNNGEGIYFMPEVGSICWLCEPSDGGKGFIIAWAPPSVDGPAQFRGHRQDLNPGDIYLGTRDGNFLILRRGGVVQIGGGPLCQRVFLPLNNTIKDFCENYGLHTLGGDLEWTIAREEKVDDGHRPANLKLKAREFADDPNPIATLEIGSHDGDTKTILTLTIKASGADGAATQISLKLDKDGNIAWDVKKDVTIKIEGKLTIDVTGDATVNAKAKLTMNVTDKFKLKGDAAIDVETSDKMTVKAASGMFIKAKVEIGGATYPVVLATPGLVSFLASHTHTCSAGPSGPPTPPCSGVESASLKSD